MEVASLALFFLLPAPAAESIPGNKGPASASASTSAPPETVSISKKKIFGVERAIDIPENVFPNEEELEELERGMEGCDHCWFESCYEGAQLHYRKWMPKNDNKPPKGIIIWLHGISAHSGRALVLQQQNQQNQQEKRKLGMALQCESWLKEGYALYALDYYGHGYSEGLRWFVPSYEVNRDDIIFFSNMVAAENNKNIGPGKSKIPLILTAESYGGCLILHVARYFQENPNKKPEGFDSIILQAPAIIPPDLPPPPVVVLLRKLAHHYPTWIPFFMPNPVSTERIWKDENVKFIFNSPRRREMLIEGGGKPYRLATAMSLLMALEDVQKDIIPGFKVPFCVIHGKQDIAVPMSGTEFLLEKSSTPKEDRAIQIHHDAYHDLMADPVAEETMKFMIDFANKRVAMWL